MTSIEWTDVTWNPVRGCSRVSEGCRNCYAEAMAARFSGPGQPYEGLVRISKSSRVLRRDHSNGGVTLTKSESSAARWTGAVHFDQTTLAKPLHWRKPRRIFVNSMSDLFHEALTDEQIAAVFGVMAACPQHTFQVLTKRPQRMREWFAWAAIADIPYPSLPDRDTHRRERSVVCRCAWMDPKASDDDPGPIGLHPSDDVLEYQDGPWPLPNVWLGVSVENQAAADERIPLLLQTPAAVRFLSCEPLLGPVDLSGDAGGSDYLGDRRDDPPGESGIDWVIAGCESGPRARPCDVDWLRSLRDQCAQAVVPFFLKQAVEQAVEAYTTVDAVVRGDGSTRKRDGLITLPYLDGVQHAAFPTSSQ